MSDAPQLLPCPFCGGKASFMNRRGDPNKSPMWAVACDCGMYIPDDDEDRDDVAQAWNARTGDDAQGASLRQALIEVTKCETALRMGGPAPEDLEGLSIALEKAVEIAANALDAAQPQAAPVETKSASEMIAACYEGLCPDGSSALDFEWARQRGYILPNNGSGKLSPAQCSAGIDGDVRKALTSLSYWCTDERSKIGNVDGYDYRSGEEYGVRKVEVEIERRLAALPADPPQPVKVTDGSDCAYRIAITPRNGAPHGAGYACGLTGGHCLAKAGCGYEPSSSMSRPHGGRDL